MHAKACETSESQAEQWCHGSDVLRVMEVMDKTNIRKGGKYCLC